MTIVNTKKALIQCLLEIRESEVGILILFLGVILEYNVKKFLEQKIRCRGYKTVQSHMLSSPSYYFYISRIITGTYPFRVLYENWKLKASWSGILLGSSGILATELQIEDCGPMREWLFLFLLSWALSSRFMWRSQN